MQRLFGNKGVPVKWFFKKNFYSLIFKDKRTGDMLYKEWSSTTRWTFYTENTLHKLLCKPKDRVAAEDKNNVVYKIWLTAKQSTSHFGESKIAFRWTQNKRSVRNCDCDKNEIAKRCWEADHNFSWDQKKVINRESRLIPKKIKETIHSLKNPNNINKISYIIPKI